MRWRIWRRWAILSSPIPLRGRIPSDKGYRFYVDNLMKDKIAQVDEMKEIMLQKADKVDQLLKQVAKLLGSEYQLCVSDLKTPV